MEVDGTGGLGATWVDEDALDEGSRGSRSKPEKTTTLDPEWG